MRCGSATAPVGTRPEVGVVYFVVADLADRLGRLSFLLSRFRGPALLALVGVLAV